MVPLPASALLARRRSQHASWRRCGPPAALALACVLARMPDRLASAFAGLRGRSGAASAAGSAAHGQELGVARAALRLRIPRHPSFEEVEEETSVIVVQHRERISRPEIRRRDMAAREEGVKAEAATLMKRAAAKAARGDIEGAVGQYKLVEDMLRSVGKLVSVQGAGLFMKCGLVMMQDGAPEAALKEYEDARGILVKEGALANTTRGARVLAAIAEAKAALGDRGGALSDFEAARSSLEQARALFTIEGAELWIRTGQLRVEQGSVEQGSTADFKRAAAACEQALAILDAEPRRPGPGQALAMREEEAEAQRRRHARTRAQLCLGDAKAGLPERAGAEAAAAHYNAARVAAEAAGSLRSEDGLRLLGKLCAARKAAGRRGAAHLADLEEATELFRSSPADASVLTGTEAGARLLAQLAAAHLMAAGAAAASAPSVPAVAHVGMDAGDAAILIDTGEKSALLAFKEARKALMAAGSPRTAEAARILADLGSLLNRRGKYAKALERIKEAMSILERMRELHSTEVGASLFETVGDLHTRLGRDEKALYAYETSRDILRSIGSPGERAQGIFMETEEAFALIAKIKSLEHRLGFRSFQHRVDRIVDSRKGIAEQNEKEFRRKGGFRPYRNMRKGGAVGGGGQNWKRAGHGSSSSYRPSLNVPQRHPD